MTLDFTQERVQELIREESYADGKAEGERNGEIKGKRIGKSIVVDNMMKELGLDLPRACAVAGLTVEEYEEMKSLLKNEE
jgi:predicted transposase YdaD